MIQHIQEVRRNAIFGDTAFNQAATSDRLLLSLIEMRASVN
jgi:hypothetical protein